MTLLLTIKSFAGRHPALMLITAALASTAGFVVGERHGDGGDPDRATVTVKVDGADADVKRDDKLIVPKAQIDAAADKLHDRDSEIASPLRERIDPSLLPAGELEGPLASDEVPGCRNRLVGNFSSRNGAAPKVIVLHETVSFENGWTSQDNLTAYASRRSSGVSWHFLIGRTNGLCTYTVPLHMKAWTQGNANPFSIGIEVEAHAKQGRYVEGKGKAKLASVVRHVARRYGIPLQRAIVRSCRVIKAGILEHFHLGQCGGGHVDVTHLSDAQLLDFIAYVRSGGVTAIDRITCRKLNAWRKAGRPKGGRFERNSVNRKRALTRRGVTCTTAGPIKA